MFVKVHVTVDRKSTFDIRPVEPHEHDCVIVLVLDDVANGPPLQPAPFLALILCAEEHHHKVGVIQIDALKQRIKIGACQLGGEVFIVED